MPTSTAKTCAAPLLEQDVGEAAGRAADVHRHRAVRIEPEMVDRVGQLDPAAADTHGWSRPRTSIAASVGDLLAGLCRPSLSPTNTSPAMTSACARVRLSARPAFHEQLVDTLLSGHEESR